MRANDNAFLLFCVIVLLALCGIFYLDNLKKAQQTKVYQDCMADIHNVYACTKYSMQFSKYVP